MLTCAAAHIEQGSRIRDEAADQAVQAFALTLVVLKW